MPGYLSRTVSVVALSLPLLSCAVSVQRSGVPDYGRARVITGASDELQDLVRYRLLSRADFKAKSPRSDMAKHAKDIGAYTCVSLPPQLDRDVDIAYDDSAGTYVATVSDAHFFAVMDPNCSWWNASKLTLPPDYVLEHEQIHFMLTEIEARKVLAEVRNMEVRAGSRVEATLGLQEQIDSAVRNATPALLEATNRFDDDTSATYAPRKQAQWRAYAEAELKRLPASRERSAEGYDDTDAESIWEPL